MTKALMFSLAATACWLSAATAARAQTDAALAIEALKSAAPNTWAKVADGPGPRSSFGLVYLPNEGRFLCFGGRVLAESAPYSEMTLDLAKGRWENRLAPKGKAWGEATGPAKAPAFPHSSAFKDAEGTVRPDLRAGYDDAMFVFNNFAYDSDRGKVVAYWAMTGQMTEYDPADNTWKVYPAAAPSVAFQDAMLWGQMCYDPVNKEVLAGQGGWAFSIAEGKWRKLAFEGNPNADAPLAVSRNRAEGLRLRARTLAGACRAEYFIAESADEAKARLDQSAAAIAKDAASLAEELKKAAASANGYEKTQLGWEAEALAGAIAELNKVEPLAAGKMTPNTIKQAEAARDALAKVVLALADRPPPRAFSPMVYDAKNKKIVLFGGNALDHSLADTWIYDCPTRAWEQRRPKLSPSPRFGHGLVYLPKSGKVALIDGYGPAKGETWVYDTAENTWQLLAEGGGPREPMTDRPHYYWFPEPAAAGDDDTVVAFSHREDKGQRNPKEEAETWSARIDPARVDAAGTAKLGVPPLTESVPTGKASPDWYVKGPAPDAAAEEAVLAKLPANTWVKRTVPNWPDIDRAWGTTVFDPDRSQVIIWSGGHATYSGNDVLCYSVRANRFYTGYAPESPMNWAGSQGGAPMQETYHGRPYIGAHTYRSYGYDPATKKMVFCGRKAEGKVFSYDPLAGDWDLDLVTPIDLPSPGSNMTATCADTPAGMVVWWLKELWRVDAANKSWVKLKVQGKLPEQRPDGQGVSYDSKRDRLLLVSAYAKGEVFACDMKTGAVAPLGPAGKDRLPGFFGRETIYISELDMLMIGTCPKFADGKYRWLLYDCAKNRWIGVAAGGDNPIGKGTYGDDHNVSMGLMHDPARKLVWAADGPGNPFVLRLDLASADVVPVEPAAKAEGQ